ncbi:hypothetical protein EMIT0194MI4_50486 [Pseudomonas sp. IT-194MI4]
MAGDWWPRITPFPVPEPWKAGIKSRLWVLLSRFDKRLAKKLSASDVSQFWFRNCGEGACPLATGVMRSLGRRRPPAGST